MISKRNLPVVLLILAAGVFVGFRTLGFGTEPTPTKYEKILRNVGLMLEEIHYSPKKLDDKFSKEVFNKYPSFLDNASCKPKSGCAILPLVPLVERKHQIQISKSQKTWFLFEIWFL